MCMQLRDQKRASNSLGLESKTAVSYPEGAGNGTCVLQNQPVLLAAEPSLQPPILLLLNRLTWKREYKQLADFYAPFDILSHFLVLFSVWKYVWLSS